MKVHKLFGEDPPCEGKPNTSRVTECNKSDFVYPDLKINRTWYGVNCKSCLAQKPPTNKGRKT